MFYNEITFVIPSYKNTVTLKRAIDSIFGQKNKKFDIQIIVSEDISDNHDEIETIIKSYNSDRIKYFVNNPRLGMKENWNHCIFSVDTKYAIMIHDDDWFYDNYLDELEHIFLSGLEFDILMFAHELCVDGEIRKNTYGRIKRLYNYIKENKIKKIENSDYYFGGMQGNFVPTCGIVYRKEFMLRTGGYGDEGYSVDEIFIEQVCRNNKVYYYNSIVSAYSYTHNTNLSSMSNTKRAFVNESFQHHMQMNYGVYKVVNKIVGRGLFLYLAYPWQEELFPDLVFTKKDFKKMKLFRIVSKIYIYSSILKFRKI